MINILLEGVVLTLCVLWFSVLALGGILTAIRIFDNGIFRQPDWSYWTPFFAFITFIMGFAIASFGAVMIYSFYFPPP